MKDARVTVCFPVDTAFEFQGKKGILPWFSPDSAAGDDVGSQKEGWRPSPPGLVLPPWRPWNTQGKNKRNSEDEQAQTLHGNRVSGNS